MSQEEPLCVQFNSKIKNLFSIFEGLPVKSFKGKMHIKAMRSRMIQGINAEPMYGITVLGPQIWKARAELAARDYQYFLDRRYERDAMELCKIHSLDYDEAINTIAYMKDTFSNAVVDVKNTIMDEIQQLLKIYAAYLKECKTS